MYLELTIFFISYLAAACFYFWVETTHPIINMEKRSIVFKFLYFIILLSLLFSPLFIAKIYFNSRTTSHEKLVRAVIDHESIGNRSNAYYFYVYNLDRRLIGSTTWNDSLQIGDTIDVFYNAENEEESYSAFTRYYPITEKWGIHMKYKKYWDKVNESKRKMSKFVGTMP